MARRRTKKRTHVGASNPTAKAPSANSISRSPKSMVIRIGAGEVGPSVSQLVKDVRAMMEPDTASRLKERRSNRLRDYVTMAGPLGVSHLLLFSRSESGNTNLRLALTPRGPTLHFRVEKYSLCKDVRRALKHPKGGGKELTTPPLLVMNNFLTTSGGASEEMEAGKDGEKEGKKVPRHLEQLSTTMFQSLFAPISPQKTPLHTIRRVMLLNREQTTDGSYILNLRHYAITTKRSGLSRPLRRLNAAEKLLHSQQKQKKGGLPNLGKLDDIADYMIGGENGEGYMTDATSGSEADTDAEVEILENTTRKILDKKRRQKADKEGGEAGVEKRAVKLVELGPRMKLRMTKVEEGVCAGKIMWHEYIEKTREEVKALDKVWEQRRSEKAERKRVQQMNVERKKLEKKAHRGARAEGKEGDDEGEDEDDSDIVKEWDSEEFDSEGLGGDGETELNEEMEDAGDFSEQEEEIANEA